MATADDSKSVVCICCDRKVVEVDPKTWKLFNEMVPKERYDEQIEPVEMPHVKSTVLKKLLTYSVRISDTTCSSDVLKTWMYDEFLHGEERLTSLMDLIKVADYLDLQSLYAGVIQYVEDKSQEEISYMVRNEDLKSLLKIVKSALYYLEETEKLWSAVRSLLMKSKEEFSQMIAKEDILGLIKLIEVAKPLSYEKLCKAVHNLILSKSIDQLSLEIHNQNLKALIKIFWVARAEKLQTLQDMVVQYVFDKSDEELVQMVSTELPCYQSIYLDVAQYLRVGTTEAEEIFNWPSNETLNQKIPIEEEAGDGSKKKDGWMAKEEEDQD
ncbi:hypothetical protein HID58_037525 [Brassica napus]|uniref:BnaA10g03660D protein n=2 Tax=Brassica napus TaxID=3708 RepID=A0A078I8N5_BRANA|nr:uncharacterized protein LOC125579401 isoform X1 [Brassica napus]KAH0905698.1 hypothetical protein HID58_037525 [Brassica napus]CAF2313281.1 unnamed protein product [Brassica napus]CDY47280.1 BnaA10g03660D [Brassica napus]